MKSLQSIGFLCLLVFFTACASKEQIRVQNVIGTYDCASICTNVDLTAQNPDSSFQGQEIIFVQKSADWDDAIILIGDREVFLEPDSSFSLSSPDYFLSGEFTADGRLLFSESIVDRNNNVRQDCDYVGYLK